MHCETLPAVSSESFFAKFVQRDLSREIIRKDGKMFFGEFSGSVLVVAVDQISKQQGFQKSYCRFIGLEMKK